MGSAEPATKAGSRVQQGDSPAKTVAGESAFGPESWPRGVARDPIYSIGQVVAVVQREFPATTVSKIRFLEDQGLLKPQRSPSGYRKYSQSDVERIRFILTQQRDSFAPLKVIAEQLAALDAGHDVTPVPPARVVASEGKAVVPADDRMVSTRELIDLTGSNEDELGEFVRAGLIVPDLAGFFPARAVVAVRLLREIVGLGIPARNLRPVRTGVERTADIIDMSVASLTGRSPQRPREQERARLRRQELGDLISQLTQELLRIRLEGE